MNSDTREGGCMCGAVRFKLSGEPIAVAMCHCKDCQKQSGSAFSLVALVPAGAVTIQGSMALVRTKADSGQVAERSFCPQCGSPICTDSDGARAQGIRILKAGLFDDTSWLKPNIQVFCGSAQPWMPELTPITRFAGMPPA